MVFHYFFFHWNQKANKLSLLNLIEQHDLDLIDVDKLISEKETR